MANDTPRTIAIAIAALLAGSPLAALCQSTRPVQTMGNVTVTGAKDAALTVPSLDKARAEIDRVPGGAGIVDAEEYMTGRAANLYDALGYATGVFVQPRFGAEEARLSIRGSGIQRTFHLRGIKLLQDGVPLNQADGGGDFQTIEPVALRYIEVFRGANALRYGSTTLGGAINFVTPTGYDAAPVDVRAEAGSFGYRRIRASGAFTGGPWDWYGYAGGYEQQGYQDHSKQRAVRLFTNGGYRIDENTETRLYVSAVDSTSYLPGSISKQQLDINPQAANPANVANDYQRNYQLVQLADKTSWKLRDGKLDLSVFYTYKDLYHPIFQVIDQNTNDFGLDFRYTHTGQIAGHRNLLTAGFTPVWGTTNANQFVNVRGFRGAPTLVADEVATNMDFYLVDEFYVTPTVALVAGAQASRATREFEDQVAPARNFDRSYTVFSPRIGVLYDVQPGIQLFGNISRGFEPPSFGELVQAVVQPNLRAQKSTTYEIGTRGRIGRSSWDLAGYYSDVRDELLTQRNNIGQTLTLNVPSTVHQGIELGGVLPLPWNFSLRGNYLLNGFRFDDNAAFGNNRLPGIPPQFLRAEVLWEKTGTYAGVVAEVSPQSYPVDMVNKVYADPYSTIGLKVGHRAKSGLSVFLEGRNLANRKYAATTGVTLDATRPGANRQFNPGDGRAMYAGVEWAL